MTAKEKAKELVKIFMFEGIYFTDGINGAFKKSKECALIAVEEIQKTKGICVTDVEYNYWEEVKQEINNHWEEVKQQINNL